MKMKALLRKLREARRHVKRAHTLLSTIFNKADNTLIPHQQGEVIYFGVVHTNAVQQEIKRLYSELKKDKK